MMANWEGEAKRFFPVVHSKGPSRKRLFNEMNFADLVLASDTVVASHFNELADIPWNHVVLDEARAIKNPNIQRTQKVKHIGAALTGIDRYAYSVTRP